MSLKKLIAEELKKHQQEKQNHFQKLQREHDAMLQKAAERANEIIRTIPSLIKEAVKKESTNAVIFKYQTRGGVNRKFDLAVADYLEEYLQRKEGIEVTKGHGEEGVGEMGTELYIPIKED